MDNVDLQDDEEEMQNMLDITEDTTSPKMQNFLIQESKTYKNSKNKRYVDFKFRNMTLQTQTNINI